MTDAEWAQYQIFVVGVSGRDDWKAEGDYWLPVLALLRKHRLTLAAAKDATLAAHKRTSSRPGDLYKGLALVLDESRPVNLPAPNDAAPCDLCGFQGLVCIERRDGQPIEVRIGGQYREVKYLTVVCTCPHGDRIKAAHGDKLPWRRLAHAERHRWQPLGGWPGESAPKLAVVGVEEDRDDIPF